MSKQTEWTPRMWQGCSLPAFLRLLWKNHFAVAPRYIYMPFVMVSVSTINSALGWLQESWFGDDLDRRPLAHPPLFILGHWRTGTTLLHELLALDPRFTYPNTYHCLSPNHFLLTEPLADICFRWMLPSRRPMDNMAVGWNRPQEDEFALCMLGQPSYYLTIAFPNHPPQELASLDVESLPRPSREKWKRAFVGFLKRVSYYDNRRLLLKSPTHSFRIPTLLELFPDAQFIHIVRNPYVVFSSTVKLWKSLYETHGLQVPKYRDLEEHVFSLFGDLYSRLEEGRKQVRPGNFAEVRYEDLIAGPVPQMQRLYEELQLGEFDVVRPRLESFWQEQADYQTNRFAPLDESLRARIGERWHKVIDQYGYTPPG